MAHQPSVRVNRHGSVDITSALTPATPSIAAPHAGSSAPRAVLTLPLSAGARAARAAADAAESEVVLLGELCHQFLSITREDVRAAIARADGDVETARLYLVEQVLAVMIESGPDGVPRKSSGVLVHAAAAPAPIPRTKERMPPGITRR